MCRRRTGVNTINVLLGPTPIQVLGLNPARKAIVLGPVAPGLTLAAPTQVQFTPSSPSFWIPPLGVLAVASVWAWGSGGNGDTNSPTTGGGGGGGGAFGGITNLPVAAGERYQCGVSAAGTGSATTFADSLGNAIVNAAAGAAASGQSGGAGGSIAGAYGDILYAGGSGADGGALSGGGGGGAAGLLAAGGAGALTVGGAGGDGSDPVFAGGSGGAGGTGAIVAAPAGNGAAPGAGGGGDSSVAAGAGNGANGLLIINYYANQSPGFISLSFRADVVPGQGMWNFPGSQAFPSFLGDCEIGTAITQAMWLVASAANTPVQITEILYDPCEIDVQSGDLIQWQ